MTEEPTAQDRLALLSRRQMRKMSRADLRALVNAAQIESDAAQDRNQELADRRAASIIANDERRARSAQAAEQSAAYVALYETCMNNFTDRDRCLELIAVHDAEFGESGLANGMRKMWKLNDEQAVANEADFRRQMERVAVIKQAEQDRRDKAAAELAEWDKNRADAQAERDEAEQDEYLERRRRFNEKAKRGVQRRLDRADRTDLEVELDILEASDDQVLNLIEVAFTAGFDVQTEQAEHLRRGRGMYSVLAGRVLQRHWTAIMAHLDANPTARRRDAIEAVGGDPRTGSEAAYREARRYNDLAVSRNRAAYIAGAEHRRNRQRERGEIV